MRGKVGKGGGGFFFLFIKKNLVFGDTWKQNNFPFSRMNIYFFFLLYDWKFGMDGRDS